MNFHLPTYRVLRRRVVKSILRLSGWRFRGQLPPSTWPQLIFVSPADGNLERLQKNWINSLIATPSVFIHNKVDIDLIEKTLKDSNTILISWNLVEDNNELLLDLFEIIRETDGRLSACAWDLAHKAIKFHSLFKPSEYSERDIKYLTRFFVYFRRI